METLRRLIIRSGSGLWKVMTNLSFQKNTLIILSKVWFRLIAQAQKSVLWLTQSTKVITLGKAIYTKGQSSEWFEANPNTVNRAYLDIACKESN